MFSAKCSVLCEIQRTNGWSEYLCRHTVLAHIVDYVFRDVLCETVRVRHIGYELFTQHGKLIRVKVFCNFYQMAPVY